jgi:hypothetical protein
MNPIEIVDFEFYSQKKLNEDAHKDQINEMENDASLIDNN